MVKRLNDIDPDKVRIVIPWENLEVGHSFFVPCINMDTAKRQLLAIASRLGMTLTFRTRVEGHQVGLRVWRTT
jgi:hypothetical protein